MQKAELEKVLSDENFVEALLSARSGEEMRVLLAKKGIVLKEEDLGKIEKEMKKIAKDGKRIVRHELTKEE